MAKPTIGELIDAMYRVREKRLSLQKQVDGLKAKQNQVEMMLMESLRDQNTRKGEGSLASASISTSINPVAKDWDALNRWILRHKELALFQKRLSAPRYRELLEEYPKGIPGAESYEQHTINLRKLS